MRKLEGIIIKKWSFVKELRWGVWQEMARDLAVAEERWCWRERVFEWAAFKRCLNKCSRAFTKSGCSSKARWRSAVFEIERTLGEYRQQHRLWDRNSIPEYDTHMMGHLFLRNGLKAVSLWPEWVHECENRPPPHVSGKVSLYFHIFTPNC